MENIWMIKYKTCGNKIEVVINSYTSKKSMIREYIKLLEKPIIPGLCELKVFKNNKDYTKTLNLFLYK